ncbi:MAG: hypothetical protein LBI35_00400 [Burkholderiales bacterium]|jgi:hypothetical protein|nr:hypothetical protein [Burkholderiales bacterium]
MCNLKKCITQWLLSEIQVPPKVDEENQAFLNAVEPLLSIIFKDLGNLLICAALGGIGFCAAFGVIQPKSYVILFQIIGSVLILLSIALWIFGLVVTFAKISQTVKKRTVAKALLAGISFSAYAYVSYLVYGTIVSLQIKSAL